MPIALLLFQCSSTAKKAAPKPNEFSAQEVWIRACSACHGIDGTPPKQWEGKGMRKFGTFGMSMGFFFGGDKMRAGIAKTIKNGKGTQMPAFGQQYTDSEIRKIVKYIEDL